MRQDLMMKFARLCLALCALLILTMPVDDAFGRAGGSYSSGRSSPSYSSQGSRGYRTYTPNSGAPISRSMTPYQNPNSGYAGGLGNNGYAGGYRPGGFWSGLLGGFGGAWLFSHFFGGGGYGYGGGGGGFGLIIGLILLFFVGRWLWRSMNNGMPGGFPRPQANTVPEAYYTGGMSSQDLSLGDQDLAAFQQALVGVQTSWGEGDLTRLRNFVTPEMLSYFAEQLSRNQSLGLANHVEDIQLQRGEPRESWSENGTDYATVYMRWSARDYTVRTDDRGGPRGSIADGDPTMMTIAEEVWTFQRARGGRWLLSAIQQSR